MSKLVPVKVVPCMVVVDTIGLFIAIFVPPISILLLEPPPPSFKTLPLGAYI